MRATEGSRLAAVLFRLKNGTRGQRRLFDQVREGFHRLFPDLEFQAVKIQNQPTIVINRTDSEYEAPLSEVGAGIFEMLLVLTHIVSERNRIFLMDEPEAHLHPHAQRLLQHELRRFSEINQLILTTHSPQFVNFRFLSSIVLVRKVKGRSIALKLPQGYLDEAEEAKASRILWSEEKEFLFSRRVLLVEGPTEYGALPIIASKLGRSLDENGVSVISVGGYHFAVSIRILSGFGIPYRVLCDEDVLNVISGHIRFNGRNVRTSALFEIAQKAGLLGNALGRVLLDLESETKKALDAARGIEVETYNREAVRELVSKAKELGFFVMLPDFEGVLAGSGYSKLLEEADILYGKNKVLKGRYVAERMNAIPPTLTNLISEVVTI